MLFERIVQTSAAVAGTRSRREKTALLAACIGELGPGEVEPGVANLAGELPQGKIGIGYATLRELRDASPAAAAASLTVAEVDAELTALGGISGAGSGTERKRRLALLFGRCTGPEAAFLGRLVVGELRQGALTAMVLDAIGQASGVTARRVRRAHMLSGELGAVARAALVEPDADAALERFSLQLFRPVLPMLAQPSEDVDAALEHLGEAALEWKLDGARVQLHKDGDEVRVYSRRLNDVTAAVPELVEAARVLPARTVILDGETLAMRADGSPHAFQTTMRRFGRRLDVDALRRTLPLSVFFFDCLYLDGEDLLDRTGRERVEALSGAVPASLVVPRQVTGDPVVADAFWSEALARGHEGLMAKSLDAPYDAGSRGKSWLKLKPAHTLDLVILAAEWGSGRRQGWLSNLHLGARDPATGGFVMIGKTFKGLTDATLAWQTARFAELEISRDAWTVYLRPELVAEIAFNDVQHSPHYAGGVALRFARLKRYRTDKCAADADTIDTVRALLPAVDSAP